MHMWIGCDWYEITSYANHNVPYFLERKLLVFPLAEATICMIKLKLILKFFIHEYRETIEQYFRQC